MPVYVITGVSKGIGFGFLRHLSEDSNNVVIGLVRDKPATETKIADTEELHGRSNIHILHADLTSHASLERAAADTEQIVGARGIDYLIANAGCMTHFDAYDPIGKMSDNVQELEDVSSTLFRTNVVGNIHLFNLFVPLILRGATKKVVAISSGHADIDWINNYDIDVGSLYAASKSALNVVVAKFSVQYKKDGVLFMAISPGAVDVGHYDITPPEKLEGAKGFMSKLAAYAPSFERQATVDEAIPLIISTWERASIKSGYGGTMVSQYGNKQWL